MKWALWLDSMANLNKLNNTLISLTNLDLVGLHMVIIQLRLVILDLAVPSQLQQIVLFILKNNIHNQPMVNMFIQIKV